MVLMCSFLSSVISLQYDLAFQTTHFFLFLFHKLFLLLSVPYSCIHIILISFPHHPLGFIFLPNSSYHRFLSLLCVLCQSWRPMAGVKSQSAPQSPQTIQSTAFVINQNEISLHPTRLPISKKQTVRDIGEVVD